MKILYFAWLRQHVGLSGEEIDPPPGVVTAADLMAWLAARSPGHARAFAEPSVVKVAVNQEHVSHEHRLQPDDEVAFFPPVTGG